MIMQRLCFSAALAALAASIPTGCPGPTDIDTIAVYAGSDPAPALALAADDLEAVLRDTLSLTVERHDTAAPACAAGVIAVDVGGVTGQHPRSGESLADQDYFLSEETCDGGRKLTLGGGSLLSAQWAVYHLTELLGVRYFHPEQTYVPDTAEWPADPIDIVESPTFYDRWFNAHRTHPIELSAPLDVGDLDMGQYQRNWIDWLLKNRSTRSGGWDGEFVGDYAFMRGFPRGAGLNLYSSQQGGTPLIDPDDPRSVEEQIAAAIEQRMAAVAGMPDVTQFGFTFNPSEFTEGDPEETVETLTFIANTIAADYPGVRVECINHGTAMEEREPYGVRFMDLSMFAPDNLEVKLHTLMFYDIVRPAPVYGNDDFSFFRDFIEDQYDNRRLHYYPESSWWLTFDLPVPLYLAPASLDARDIDMAYLRPFLSDGPDAQTGVYGHETFSSGQEWGYWLIDYCTTKMSWDIDFTARDCIADVASIFRKSEPVIQAFDEAMSFQADIMREPDIVRFLVGSDDETEVAFDTGIVFHPLPPRPGEILTYTDEQAQALTDILAQLDTVALNHHAWAQQIDESVLANEGMKKVLLEEMRDGFEVFSLRASHAIEVYQAALDLRAAIAATDLDAIDAAFTGVELARAFTTEATSLVRAQEARYRYPAALTIVGDEPGTEGAIENKTIYPYRYLGRTHRMFYWHRPDEQLAMLFGDGLELVRPNRRLLPAGQALTIDLLADGVSDLQVDRGDGTVDNALAPYTYADQGVYHWTLDATSESGVIHHEDDVAIVDRRFVFARGRLDVIEPEGASLLAGLMPGFVVGLMDGPAGEQIALGRVDEHFDEQDLVVAAHAPLTVRPRNGMVSEPGDLSLELRDVGNVNVYDAVIDLEPHPDYDYIFYLNFEGVLRIQEVIDLLVGVGGFEEVGARQLVADILEYTPETLPDEVSFRLRADGTEENLDPAPEE